MRKDPAPGPPAGLWHTAAQNADVKAPAMPPRGAHRPSYYLTRTHSCTKRAVEYRGGSGKMVATRG
ncbi:MAG: hypothetical protein ACP5I3_06765 [Thermoproteus sp.]